MSTTSSSTPSCNRRSIGNSVAAGYMAGVTGTLVGHPLDSAKVWLQTGRRTRAPAAMAPQTTAAVSAPPSSTTAASALGHSQQIIRQSSTLAFHNGSAATSPTTTSNHPLRLVNLRALYAGVSGPLVTVGLVQSINFAIYDSMRRTLYQRNNNNNSSNSANHNNYLWDDSLANVAQASMTAGAVLACLTNPLMLIKTYQQTHGSSNVGVAEAVRRIMQRSSTSTQTGSSRNTNWRGLRHLYTGFAPHCVSEIVGRGIYFCCYEACKRQLAHQRLNNNNNSATTATTNTTAPSNTIPERMISAAVAGVVCWSVIFPLDAIRCRMYATGATSVRRTVADLVHHSGGVRALYRGYGVTLLRAGPVAALVLPVYDGALDVLQARVV